MTRGNARKKAVRQRMKETGEPYALAARSVPPPPPPGPGSGIASASEPDHDRCQQCGARNRAKHPLCLACRRDLVADEFVENLSRPGTPWEAMSGGVADLCRWKCRACSSTWSAKLSSRTGTNQTGCPECHRISNRAPSPAKSLTALRPDIACQFRRNIEMPGRGPDRLGPASRYLCEWECDSGHLWSARVVDRTAGSGCPACRTHGRSRLEFEVAALLSTATGLVVELHQIITLATGRRREVDLRLPEVPLIIELDPTGSHGSSESVDRDTRKTQQLIADGHVVLRARHRGLPVLGVDGYVHVEVAPGLNAWSWAQAIGRSLDAQGIAWKNLDQDEITSALIAATRRWSEVCAAPPSPSALDAAPHLADEFLRNLDHPGRGVDWMPPGCTDRCVWQCQVCLRTWEANLDKRTLRGQGCPDCGRQKLAQAIIRPKPGESLADREPDIAAELVKVISDRLMTAQDLRRGSGLMCLWQCSVCGHEWEATPNARTNPGRKSGCPPCSVKRRGAVRRRPAAGQSLADLNPDLAKELVKVIDDPTLTAWDIGPGSGKRCLWRCAACGHEWTTTPDQRTKRGTGCKACWERRRRGRTK